MKPALFLLGLLCAIFAALAATTGSMSAGLLALLFFSLACVMAGRIT